MAALAAGAAAWPDVAWYIDNAPHLLEVEALARDALPAGSFAGWTDLANAGMVVGQHNAPLAWLPLAAARAAGLPVLPLYQLGIVLSNVVYALGALALGRRLLGDPRAATLAAMLAAIAPADLLGVAGALGGMWPYRLANGLFLLGLAVPPQRRGYLGTVTWLAATVLGHTFTAVIGLGVAALELVAWGLRGQRAAALRGLAGLATALLLTAAFWGPLLDPALRRVEGFWATGLDDTLALLLVPFDLGRWLMVHRLEPLGGPLAWLPTGVLLGGALVGLVRRPAPADRPLALVLLLALALVLLGAAVLHPLLRFDLLGPNPWRHYTWWRLALALLAGAGLAPWLGGRAPRAALGLALGLLLLGLGRRELAVAHAADRAALTEAWALTEALPPGRVYHQDTFGRQAVGPGLRHSHPGGLYALATGRPVLGSWYSVFPLPTLVPTLSEFGLLFGVPEDEVPAGADWLWGMLRKYGVVGVVAVEPGLQGRLDGDPRFARVGAAGPHVVYRLVDPPLPVVGVRPDQGTVEQVEDAGTTVRARLGAEGPVEGRLRKTWHPWWEATVDGQPVPVAVEADTGLLTFRAPAGGALELRWRDRGRPWRWASLAGLLVALAGGWHQLSRPPRGGEARRA